MSKRSIHSFDSALLEAIDEALMELGECGREALYLHVASTYSISKEQIPKEFAKFLLAVRNEFGVGSRAVEALILENLYWKLGPNSEEFQMVAMTMVSLSLEFQQTLERETCG